MTTDGRHTPTVGYTVDQRIARLVRATETFVGAFGAALSEIQAESDPEEFARLVDTLGFGRARAEAFMATARMQSAPSEIRPSAWFALFRRPEPIPMLPGEADPVVDYAAAKAEPAQYRRRVDLLSADGLALLLVALHEPSALGDGPVAALASWFEGAGGRSAAVATLRSWRQTVDASPPDVLTDGGSTDEGA